MDTPATEIVVLRDAAELLDATTRVTEPGPLPEAPYRPVLMTTVS